MVVSGGGRCESGKVVVVATTRIIGDEMPEERVRVVSRMQPRERTLAREGTT